MSSTDWEHEQSERQWLAQLKKDAKALHPSKKDILDASLPDPTPIKPVKSGNITHPFKKPKEAMTLPENRKTELFELCKEVYEKLHWRDTEWVYCHGRRVLEAAIEFDTSDMHPHIPDYTSDYLLEKLPLFINNEPRDELSLLKTDTNWGVGYFRAMDSDDGIQYLASISANSDTPLKALLKLTLALYKAGELK